MTQPFERLLTADHSEAGTFLADAFFDNPAHVCILPDEATRRRRLQWLMRRNVAIQDAVGKGYCQRSPQPGRGIDAMNFWQAPDTPTPGLRLLIQHGILAAPLRLGLSPLRRLLEVTEHIEEQRQGALAGRSAWTLHNMVVRKELRGSGVGRSFLAAQLARIVDPSGQLAILATQRPANVRFYERLGFEVASETALGARPTRFLNWIMLRAPGAGSIETPDAP